MKQKIIVLALIWVILTGGYFSINFNYWMSPPGINFDLALIVSIVVLYMLKNCHAVSSGVFIFWCLLSIPQFLVVTVDSYFTLNLFRFILSVTSLYALYLSMKALAAK